MFSLLITLVATLVIVGAILWGLQAMPALDASIKQIIKVMVIVAAIIWCVLVLVGVFAPESLPPRLRSW